MSVCISLQGNAVQIHSYNPLSGTVKAAYKLATYSRQDPHSFLHFFSASSNTSSVFLYWSKSTCFKPWNFIDFSRQISNIFVLLSFALLLAVIMSLPFLCPPYNTYTTPWSLECSSACDSAGRDENARTGSMAVAGHCKHSWVHWIMLCWDGTSE